MADPQPAYFVSPETDVRVVWRVYAPDAASAAEFVRRSYGDEYGDTFRVWHAPEPARRFTVAQAFNVAEVDG